MIDKAISALAGALDRALAGQEDAKTGVLLALLAREHAYLEGPPGAGKSRLAEALACAAAGAATTLAFHRDTRLWDLVGPMELRREPRGGGGERVRQLAVPGPLLRAELLVLDDLQRAPGQALGPLLRILSERSWQGRALPLESAIATGLPESIDSWGDPLAPGSLDCFAIQVRMPGLVYAQRWACAQGVLDRGLELWGRAVIDGATRRRLQEQALRMPIPDQTQRTFVDLVFRLQRFVSEGACLSDRTFGRAALRVLQAHALLRGASRVEHADLRALRYMLACRLPDLSEEQFEELLAEAQAGESPRVGPFAAGAGATWGAGGEAASERIPAGVRTRSLELEPAERVPGTEGAEVERILRALEGRFERGCADLEEDPGGCPRRYRTLRCLDEVFDADPVEVAGYLDGTRPGLPRSFRRERRRASGKLALLRDVSASMEGRLGHWAGQVVAGLVRAGARRHMRVGYVEFNHDARRFHAGGRFFHRRYTRLLGLAASSRAAGRTNYEAPLRIALDEFRARAGRNRHIVLVTDGVPVLGDPEVSRERALARRLDVRVHTVFVGLGDPPPVLDAIARETGGLCFVGRARPQGGLRVLERGEGA